MGRSIEQGVPSRLLNIDVKDIIKDIIADAFALVGTIDPQLQEWLSGTSSVGAVLRDRPRIRK